MEGMDILNVLLWSTIGGVLSLIGGLVLLKAKNLRKRTIELAMPFGAGALLAAAFMDLLPESIDESGSSEVMIYTLIGFLIFFVLERLLGWFHHHHHDEAHGARDKTHASLVIIGDTLHNALDGVAIGAAFLVSVPTGIVTALAVAAHEIPQEIGDFGILLGKGLKPKKVLIVNLASSLATVVAALAVFTVGSASESFPVAPVIALTAGMFIYIAASDIVPEIHEKPHATAMRQSAMLLTGVVLVAVASVFFEGLMH